MNRKRIKMMLLGFLDRLEQMNATRVEKTKYQDKRRIEKYKSIILTKEQINEINDLYISNYGKRIPTTWHRSYTAYSGTFDKYYFPEVLYIPRFERYMNFDRGLASVLENKNLLYAFAEFCKVKMPSRILSCQEGLFSGRDGTTLTFDEAVELLSDIGNCFAKPSIGTDSGRGCKVYNFKSGVDSNSQVTCQEALTDLGNNFTVQERLVCHESIRKLYSGSVNTFRIMTYRWHNTIESVPVIMRIGRNGSYLDNAHAGGMFIAVSPDGTLHEKAFTEFESSFTEHPDTKVVFKDYKIDQVPMLVETAKIIHSSLPSVGVVNWDMTIDENGDPVLIEANVIGGSIWLFQIAHGKGVFGEKTPEILRWIKKMDQMSFAERQKHHFGD